MKKILLSLFAVAIAASSYGQADIPLVKEVKAQEGSLNIPYKRYVLKNGLNILIHEDHSDPIVHVEVTYHVGSARESMGKSGFAHLFEHMMFQGSGHVADEEHFKIVQGAGGQMNGTTNHDITNYFETLPSNYLETALYLESDRMGYLLDSLTKKKFEVQRSTVKNEKGQRYGRPYGMVAEFKDQALYGSNGHPYSWPVIGYTDDLDRVTVEDARKFFMRWYGPNNATLVIAGDVNTAEALKLVDKYFGKLNRCPDVVDQKVPRVILPEDQIKTFKDWVYFPEVGYTFPTVPQFHKDEAPLSILADIMGGSRKSIFYKKFIDEREDYLFAGLNHTNVFWGAELGGEFSITVRSFPGNDITAQMKKTRDLIMNTINEFESVGFSDDDLKASKNSIIAGFSGINESIGTKAAFLSKFEVFTKGKVNVQDMMNEYSKVTKEDVMRVYRQYIKNKNAAIVQVIPDPKQNLAGVKYKPVPSFNQYANVKNDPKDAQYKNLVYNRSVDGLDRTVRPEKGQGKIAKTPTFWTATLENGLQIYGTDNPGSERIYMSVSVKGGQLLESNGKYPLGTANMTAGMMNEGTQKYTVEELEFELAKMGSSMGFGSGKSSLNGSVSCYNDQFGNTMKFLEERLLNPNFDKKHFKKDQKAILQGFRGDKNSSGRMVAKGWSKIIFGDDNILGENVSGTPGSVSKISTNTLAEYHRNNISPNVARIIVVGNISKEEFLKQAAFLKTWENKHVKMPEVGELPKYETNQIFLIDNPSAKQSQMRVGYRTIPYDAYGDYYKTNVANFALGGSFNSRINLSLREDHGWTYGARSFQTQGVDSIPGYFVVSGSIKREATDSAIAEVMRIMHEFYDSGITQEELDFTKNSMMSSGALSYEGAGGRSGYLQTISARNLPANYREKQMEVLQAMTVEDVNAIIRKYIRPEEMVVFVVGNKFYIGKGLSELGYGKPTLLGTDGSGNKKPKKKPKAKKQQKKGGDKKMFPPNK